MSGIAVATSRSIEGKHLGESHFNVHGNRRVNWNARRTTPRVRMPSVLAIQSTMNGFSTMGTFVQRWCDQPRNRLRA